MHLKLGEFKVLSTKIFFKIFGKSKSRHVKKMCTSDRLVFGSQQFHLINTSAVLLSCCLLRFLIALQRNMSEEKQCRFPYIRGLLHLSMNRLEIWWLSVWEIPTGGNSPHVSPHFPLHVLMFHLVFPLFLRHFVCFP